MAWIRWLGVWLVASACGDDSAVTHDAGHDGAARVDSAVRCAASDDCDDGLYCTGAETCDPANSGADSYGCVTGAAPCTTGVECDEATDHCITDCEAMGDADMDGFPSIDCGGHDCDDADATAHPGAPEICDAMNIDEDCDPSTFGFRDGDADLSGDARCCNGTQCGADCDDANPGVHPGLPEVCDLFDNDCDMNTDEGVLVTYYEDADGDTFGSRDPMAMTMTGCFLPMGYSVLNTDCDDTRRDVNPVAPEICERDLVDENCDGMVPSCPCSIGDTRACELPGRCGAGTQSCVAGVWGPCPIDPVPEVCNMEDDNCNGLTDEGLLITCFTDLDGDTYAPSGAVTSSYCPVSGRPDVGGCPAATTNRMPVPGAADCNDTNSTIRPSAVEVCIADTMALDEDCDGSVDEGVSVSCYTDNDNDTYAPAGSPRVAKCRVETRPLAGFCPPLFTSRAPASMMTTDCLDSNFSVNPASPEVCEGMLDENCNGVVDKVPPCSCISGRTESCPLPGICAMGTRTCAAGAWGPCSILPGSMAETCNGIDQDCDGAVDEGTTTTCYADGDGDGYAVVGAMPSSVCGACPAGTTFTAPRGADVDCNDMVRTIAPGAPEACNRIDDDCSSGGGAEPSEDFDDDGYTAIGFGGCSTGFPSTDCHDTDARAHPGADWASTPYCDAGASCTCPAIPGVRNLTYGCPGPGLCNCDTASVAQWDFNCDGVVARQPPACQSTPIVVCGPGLGAGCWAGPGSTSSTAQCGEFTGYAETCNPCPTCGVASGTIGTRRCR